jgi:Flp pilus assembly pilin Flp
LATILGRARKINPLDLETTRKEEPMELVRRLWNGEEGQDIAEYAVMLAVILVIVVGTIRLIGSNANNVFSNVASSIQ